MKNGNDGGYFFRNTSLRFSAQRGISCVLLCTVQIIQESILRVNVMTGGHGHCVNTSTVPDANIFVNDSNVKLHN